MFARKPKALYRISKKEREELEALRKNIVFAQAAYGALVRHIMMREHIPDTCLFEQNEGAFYLPSALASPKGTAVP